MDLAELKLLYPIGSIVKVLKEYEGYDKFNGEYGKVIAYEPRYKSLLIKFDKIYYEFNEDDGIQHDGYGGQDPSRMSRYFGPDDVEHASEENKADYFQKIQKKKELNLKMKDIDPYGEEDWLEEKLITKFSKFSQVDEKMSINPDVKKISDMMLSNMRENPDKKHIILNDIIISNDYKIKEISMNIDDDIPHVAYFNKPEAEKTKDGFILNIKIKDSIPERLIRSTIYHEIQHAVDWVIKYEKEVKQPKLDYHKLNMTGTFKGLERMIYMSHDSEMKSRLHDIYTSFKYYLEQNNITNPTNDDARNFIRKVTTEGKVYWVCWKYMIKYNIMDEVRQTQHLKEITKIVNDIYETNYDIENQSDKNEVMIKLKDVQKRIRSQGEKYKKRAYKVLSLVLDEYNNEKNKKYENL